MTPVGLFIKSALIASFGVVTWISVCAQEITSVSPFLPRGAGAGVPTENGLVELRGIMRVDGDPVFGLYDPVNRKGGWVKLNQAAEFPAMVRSYDGTEMVTVEYQGRTLTLKMKDAKIEVASMAPAPVPQIRPGGPAQPTVSAPPSDDARRLEAVAAEVARRRQARQAAQQQVSQPPAPQPAPAQAAPNQPAVQRR
ncbi:MAG: hypothetical protein QM790_14560 [Nibricoccus sp.]